MPLSDAKPRSDITAVKHRRQYREQCAIQRKFLNWRFGGYSSLSLLCGGHTADHGATKNVRGSHIVPTKEE